MECITIGNILKVGPAQDAGRSIGPAQPGPAQIWLGLRAVLGSLKSKGAKPGPAWLVMWADQNVGRAGQLAIPTQYNISQFKSEPI